MKFKAIQELYYNSFKEKFDSLVNSSDTTAQTHSFTIDQLIEAKKNLQIILKSKKEHFPYHASYDIDQNLSILRGKLSSFSYDYNLSQENIKELAYHNAKQCVWKANQAIAVLIDDVYNEFKEEFVCIPVDNIQQGMKFLRNSNSSMKVNHYIIMQRDLSDIQGLAYSIQMPVIDINYDYKTLSFMAESQSEDALWIIERPLKISVKLNLNQMQVVSSLKESMEQA